MKKTSTKIGKGMNALVWQEQDLFVAQGIEIDVASQGKTKAQALKNLSEAIGLYLEDEKVSQPITPRSKLSIHQITPKSSYA